MFASRVEMMYRRFIEKIFLELLNEFRIIYLTGPRQAGKTTLVRAIAEKLDITYLTLDDNAVLASAINDPQGFIQSLSEKNVILDEFQYAPCLMKINEKMSTPPRIIFG